MSLAARLPVVVLGLALALGPMSIAACAAPEAEPIAFGSKKFTESVILGEIGAQLADHHGHASLHRPQLGGTRVLWEALLAGDIDAYPEYTGTLTEEIFAGDSSSSQNAPPVGIVQA